MTFPGCAQNLYLKTNIGSYFAVGLSGANFAGGRGGLEGGGSASFPAVPPGRCLWLGAELEREQWGLTSVQAAVLPPRWDRVGKGDLVPAWPNALH